MEYLDYFIRLVRGDAFWEEGAKDRMTTVWYRQHYSNIREPENREVALKVVRDQIRARRVQTSRVLTVYKHSEEPFSAGDDPAFVEIQCPHKLDIAIFRAILAAHRENWEMFSLRAYDALPNGMALLHKEMFVDQFVTVKHELGLTLGRESLKSLMLRWKRGPVITDEDFRAVFLPDLKATFGLADDYTLQQGWKIPYHW